MNSSCTSSEGPPRPTIDAILVSMFVIIEDSFCISARIVAISSSGSSADEVSTSMWVRLVEVCNCGSTRGGEEGSVDEEDEGEEAQLFRRLFLFSANASSLVFHFSKVLSIKFIAWVILSESS